MPPQGEWCPHCGQKTPERLVPTFRELVRDSIETLFNLDNRIFLTLWALLRPGTLTYAWLEGRRKRYYPPFRIFFVAALLYFALHSLLQWPQPDKHPIVQVSSDAPSDVLQKNERYLLIDSLRQVADKWYASDPSLARTVLDTLLAHMPSPCSDSIVVEKANGTAITVCENDLLLLSPSQFFEKYGITDSWSRLTLGLAMKILQSSNDLNEFLLNHFVWFLIGLIPLLAAWARLLFRKAEPRYVVHLVMLLHVAAFVLGVLSAARLLLWAGLNETLLSVLFVPILPAYHLGTLRRCLRLSWRAILWRWALFALLSTWTFAMGLLLYTALAISFL